MPTDKKSSKRVEKQPANSAGTSNKRVIKPPVGNEPLMPPRLSKNAVKSNKRLEKLLSDIKHIADQPYTGLERRAPQPLNDNPEMRRELEALGARILELEAQLKDRVKHATAKETQANPASPILYEKERVGYVYSDDTLKSLQAGTTIEASNAVNALTAPLTASEETIGEMQIEAPSQRSWTMEETNLANAVARQASLQIQNLRLLAAAERARAEAQDATRQFTHQNWESFLDGIHQTERIGFIYDQAGVAPYGESSPADADFQETVTVLDEQIGNVYVKSDPTRPFTNEDKAMVSAVARQLAQQVENLRLLADAARARAEAEAATRRLTGESWQAFTAQQDEAALSFMYDSNQVTPLSKSHLPQDVTFVQPLTVRGETIGQLTVAGLKDVSKGALELANSIAEQVSVHIENLRLFELNEKRARELGTVAAVSTTASTVLDPDELLQAVVDLTRERFGLYHAHIYLADESWNTLLLASGAGEIGRQMVSEGWAIPINHEQSIAASAARNRQFVIANDVYHDKESSFLSNRLLPETRSEMAVPMIVGEKLLGVFDVQADTANYFTEEDANIYTTLASQVAVALQNARLYVQQSATLTQLRELDRLKSSFLANMSHELRTPLNSILGFADVMIEELDGPLTPNMDNDLRLIQKNGQHLLHLINDVLDMAKIESGRMNLNPEKFRLQELFEEVTSITAPMASEKNLALFIAENSDQAVAILADRTRLRQVMINLVNNSIKFTEVGKIAICAEHIQNNVLITVRDTGMGIPPDKLEVVFQEFTQVDISTTRKAGGTGLGLPISRRLIEMHGGRLWASRAKAPPSSWTSLSRL
jgi:signal transduction histidine kinase